MGLQPGFSKNAQGSCLVHVGNTVVLCTASVDDRVPGFLKGRREGWLSAEYGMLPHASSSRMKREAVEGQQKGRTQEIQRLISRTLRASFDLKALGERQILVDCDVLQADGGTRCAAIVGGYVAAYRAVKEATRLDPPVREIVAAVSGGVVDGLPVLDLDYSEDSRAQMDANFILTPSGKIVELQACGETGPFDPGHLQTLLGWARKSILTIVELQEKACNAPNKSWESCFLPV